MIEQIGVNEWIQFDASHPAPTFFARPAWALALAHANPSMHPSPMRIRLDDGLKLLVPLMRMSGGKLRWREYLGFPLGAYTCFIREDGTLAAQDECERAVRALTRVADSATIVPWPLGPAPQTGTSTRHETSVVDLSNGIDAALAGVAGIFRRMAGQAERRGVTCAPCNEPDAVDRYYRLLELSAQRWGIGKPSTPKALIEALVQHGGADVEVWFARADGRDIGGGVVFYGSQEFFFWSAAMDSEFGKLRPSNALNFALMRAAAARGMRWYNLGSSEGLPGVAKFKDSLGAQEIFYDELRIARTPYKLYSNVRRVLGAHVNA